MAESWSQAEVDRTVETYFSMLSLELEGQPYSKADHRRELMKSVDRSNGSIEFKFQNISAALMEMGAVPIIGYKPARNMQGLLRERVAERFSEDADVRRLMMNAMTAEVSRATGELAEPTPPPPGQKMPQRHARIAQKVDFQAIEAANRALGRAGELLVVRAEQRRLSRLGEDRLAARVEHVSETQGDGLGFDILSWNPDGSERFLEVKTTRSNEFQPFLVSRNEVEFSSDEPEKFALVRVFGFDRPSLGHYELPGPLAKSADLRPEVYSGRPA